MRGSVKTNRNLTENKRDITGSIGLPLHATGAPFYSFHFTACKKLSHKIDSPEMIVLVEGSSSSKVKSRICQQSDESWRHLHCFSSQMMPKQIVRVDSRLVQAWFALYIFLASSSCLCIFDTSDVVLETLRLLASQIETGS